MTCSTHLIPFINLKGYMQLAGAYSKWPLNGTIHAGIDHETKWGFTGMDRISFSRLAISSFYLATCGGRKIVMVLKEIEVVDVIGVEVVESLLLVVS
ncbi:hypothetical protein Tco_1118764 [Tanacetum coccineum]